MGARGTIGPSAVAELGLTWVRISTDRMAWEQAQSSGGYSHFHINPCQDKLVA